MLANKADLGDTPLTAIFPPWGTVDLDGVGSYSFKYTSRLKGDGSIQARVKNDFPEASASTMIGFRQLFPADLDMMSIRRVRIWLSGKHRALRARNLRALIL